MTYYVERIHYVLGDGTARHCNADLPGTLDQIEDRVRRITQDGCWISGGTDDVPGVVRSFLSPTAIRMIDIIAVERPKLATGKTVRLDRADDPQTTVTPIRADNPPKEAPTMTTYASSLARLKATRDALHQQHADNAFASDNLANAIAFLDRQIGLDAQSMVDMGLSDEVRLLLGAPPVALHLHLEQPAAEPFRCPTCGNGLQVVAISRYTQLCDIDEATGAWSVSCRCCYCRALYALWLQDEHTAPTGTFELAVPPPTRVAEEIPCSRRLR